MTDWNKFNLSEYDERQKQIRTRGLVIALVVYAVLTSLNLMIMDFYRWTDAEGVIFLCVCIAMSVYVLYTASRDSYAPANEKELSGGKKPNPLWYLILVIPDSIFVAYDIAGGHCWGTAEDGHIMFDMSSSMLLGSLILMLSLFIAAVIHRSREKRAERE